MLSLRQVQFHPTSRSKSERFGKNAEHPARAEQIRYYLEPNGAWVIGKFAFRFNAVIYRSLQSRFRNRDDITEYDFCLLSSRSNDPGIDSIDNESEFWRMAGDFTVRRRDLDAQRG